MEILVKDSTLSFHENSSSHHNASVLSQMHGTPEVLYSVNAINALICFVGLTGNILVFYVVCRFSAMHTVTNIFILMLALADIAFLVNIPMLIITAILKHWPFGDTYCKIYYSMTTVSQFASSFFLVTMSADRYVAICHPVRARRIRTTQNAVLVCTIVWTLAIVLMYPVFLYATTDSDDDGYSRCNIFWPDYFHVSGYHAFILYCFILGYALPVAFMLTFYGLVIQKLRSRHRQHQAAVVAPSSSTDRRRNKVRLVTLMIFIVIVVFLICWTPFWASQLTIVFSSSSQYDHALSSDPITAADINASQNIIYTSLILQCLCFANSAVNPILYAILSENFKQSYAKACHRITRTPDTRTSLIRDVSFRPDFEQHTRRLALENTNFNCELQPPSSRTPSILTPSFAQPTSEDNVCNRNPRKSCYQDSTGYPLLKGEVVASFQVTKWNPSSKRQAKVVVSKTLLTTFEVPASERGLSHPL